MNIDGEFPEVFRVETEIGKEYEVKVEYSWITKKNVISVTNFGLVNNIVKWELKPR